MQVPLWRRLGAFALLGGAGVWFVSQGLHTMLRLEEAFYGALLVAGAVLLTRRSVVSQVLGRGAAWALFGPVTLEIGAELLFGTRPEIGLLVMSAVSFSSDLPLALSGFAAAVFGGLVSLWRTLLGGLVLGVIGQLVAGYVAGTYQTVIALVMMLIIMIARHRSLSSEEAK